MPEPRPSAHWIPGAFLGLCKSSFICQKFTSIPTSPAKLLQGLILQGHNFLWSISQPRQNSDSFCPPTASLGVTTLFIIMHCDYLSRNWESLQSRYYHLLVSPCHVILHSASKGIYGQGRKCKLPCCYCKQWEYTKLKMTGTSSRGLVLQKSGVTLGMGICGP